MPEKENSPTLSVEKNSAAPKLLGIKIATLTAVVFSLTALAGAVTLYRQLNTERRQRQALEAAQVQFQEKTNSFEAIANQYRSEMERMREQLKTYGADRQQLQEQLDKSREEIAGLQKKIKGVEGPELLGDSAEESFPSGQASAADLKVPAPKGAKSARAGGKTAPKSLQVLTVNRKFNFVVVNLGIRDDLKLGDQLSIERNGKTIGRVQVEKLYENFSAATILQEPKEAPMKGGESVRRS